MIYHIFNITLIISNFLFSLITYGHLPEAMPEHYSSSGLPDRMVETSVTNWFLLPLLSIIITLLLYLSFLSKISPEKWNIFEDGEFERFSDDKQDLFKKSAKNLITTTFSKMAIVMNLVFLSIQVLNYLVGTGKLLGLQNYFVVAVFVLLFYVVGEFILKFFKLKDTL